MLLAFRRASALLLAPLAALVTVIFSQSLLLASHPEVFKPSLGSFIALYFPLFFAGCPDRQTGRRWPTQARSKNVPLRCGAARRAPGGGGCRR
jgi:hypothetical protein